MEITLTLFWGQPVYLEALITKLDIKKTIQIETKTEQNNNSYRHEYAKIA